MQPNRLLALKHTWPIGRYGGPGGGGAILRYSTSFLTSNPARSLSDPELAKGDSSQRPHSTTTEGSISATSSFNWSLKPREVDRRRGVQKNFFEKCQEKGNLSFTAKPRYKVDTNLNISYSCTFNQINYRQMRVESPQRGVEKSIKGKQIENTRTSGKPRQERGREEGNRDMEEREREEAIYELLPHRMDVSSRLRHI